MVPASTTGAADRAPETSTLDEIAAASGDMDMDMDLALIVARLGRVVERSLAELELTLPQYRILAILDRGAEDGVALAKKLAVRPPTVTAVVDGLVARGLVVRSPSPGDRRKVSHTVSETGHELSLVAKAAAAQAVEQVADRIEPDSAKIAVAALALWDRAMARDRAARRAALPPDRP
jgi:long-chain acyl-CoA synthetase